VLNSFLSRIVTIVGIFIFGLFLLLAAGASFFFDLVVKKGDVGHGVAALYTARAFVDHMPAGVSPESVNSALSQFLGQWGAAYVVYPSSADDQTYLVAHGLGSTVVTSQLLDQVLRRGHLWLWKRPVKVIRQGGEGQPRIVMDNIQGEGRFLDYSTVVGGREVHVGFSENAILAGIRPYLVIEILGIALILLLGIALLYFVLRRQFASLDQLVGYARKLGRREFTAFCPVNEQGELGVIAGALQTAAGDLRATYDQLEEAAKRSSVLEAEALRQVSYLHGIVDLCSEGVAFTSAVGEMILVNSAFCSLMRMSEEELVGQSFADIGLGPIGDLIVGSVGSGNRPQQVEIDLPGGRIGRFSVCATSPHQEGHPISWSGVVVVREVSGELQGERVIAERLAALLSSSTEHARTIAGLGPVIRQHCQAAASEEGRDQINGILNQIEQRGVELLSLLDKS
jgi:PAS domain-containing protein